MGLSFTEGIPLGIHIALLKSESIFFWDIGKMQPTRLFSSLVG